MNLGKRLLTLMVTASVVGFAGWIWLGGMEQPAKDGGLLPLASPLAEFRCAQGSFSKRSELRRLCREHGIPVGIPVQ